MADIKKTDPYWIIKPIWDSKGYMQGYEVFRSIPSADVAPIVRCKDCKYWQPSECGVVELPYCKHLGYKEETGLDIQIGNENDYCSFGERRR